MKMITYQNFGLPINPWKGQVQQTADAKRIHTLIYSATHDQAFVSILGERGSGKTYAIRSALTAAGEVTVVELLRLTRDKLHMGDIETALIRELSDESPKRSGEARSHQVKRILGAANMNKNIVLVIDDSHVLHHHTLRSLKRLREFSWLNKSPLLGIVLVGQKDKTQGIAEVQLRSDQVWLQGLTAKEAQQAINRAMGNIFTDDAIILLAQNSMAKNWLDLQHACYLCLAKAQAQGMKIVSKEIVNSVLTPTALSAKTKSLEKPADDQAIAAHLNSKQSKYNGAHHAA